MSATATVMFSRVRLARNYRDLPFDLSEKPEKADALIARTCNAISMSPLRDTFEFYRMRELNDIQRHVMEESRLITEDLLKNLPVAAALVNHRDGLSILMNEEDHVRIMAVQPGMELLKAADDCFRVDDALSMHTEIAFDPQLGYLTACPTNTGTGMRASLVLHLPMLVLYKQMGNVGQTVAKLGLNIRGVYGEGSEAWGNMYQISNQATLGRAEDEILHTVLAVGHQLIDKEKQLREKYLENSRISLEDAVFRAVGIMTHARILKQEDFFRYWSNLRLGIVSGLLPMELVKADRMIEEVMDAHLAAYHQRELTDAERNIERASRVRNLMHKL